MSVGIIGRTGKLKLSLMLLSVLCSLLVGCGSSFAATPLLPKSRRVLSQSCPSTIPAGQPVAYWPMNANQFQGVFQFTGQANSRNAANPYISGANLEWSWAEIEPTEGVYNWKKVDRDIQTWTSKGKKVILRFATGGQISWSGSVADSYTPPWIFNTYGVPRVHEINGTVFPVYWNTIFLQKLTAFVNAAAARYDMNAYVAAVEIGIGQGGETEPDGSASQNPHQLQLWQRYGYTNALWWQTIQRIVAIYESAWTHTPLALMTTSTFLKYDDRYYNRALVEQYAVHQGLWLQINSLDDAMPNSILAKGVNQLTTTVEEQRQSALDSGYPAIDDVKHGIALGARYVLVFASDLTRSSNADALAYARQQITPPVLQDCTSHNLPLSVTGRVAPVPGSNGQPGAYAQFFDGATGSASAGQTPPVDAATWSLGAWLYPTTLPQSGAVAVMDGADSGGFGFGIAGGAQGGTGSRLVAYFPGIGWVDSGYTFPVPRQWYHVVVTRDGSTVRFYVNGVQAPLTSMLSPITAASHFSIGSSFDTSTRTATHFFTGAIDDVIVYASALSDAQVKGH